MGARRVVRWLAAGAALLFCGHRLVGTLDVVRESSAGYSYVRAWRSIASAAGASSPALLCEDASSPAPVERTRLIALAWERPAGIPHAVDRRAGLAGEVCVFTSRWVSAQDERWLASAGFVCAATNDYACAWRPAGPDKGAAPQGGEEKVPGRVRESLSLVLLATLLLMLWRAATKGDGREIPRGAGWVALGLFALLCAVVLQHPLLPPNGLGTYGGKAKLLWHCGGFPGGYWDADGFGVLQPAYPPGLTILALAHFLLSGGYGDRLVQVLLPLGLTLQFLELAKGGRRLAEVMPFVLYLVSPVAIRLASGFYAEPFAALALLAGWNAMRRGWFAFGAVVMGCAGLFRLEAGVAAVVYAFAQGLAAKRGGVSQALCLGLAAAPVLCWMVPCRLMGCWISDWDFARMPDFVLTAHAVVCEAEVMLCCVLPVAVLIRCAAGNDAGSCAGARRWAFGAFGLLLLAMPLACGFYASRHGVWMVDNTIPRLVWYLAIIPLASLCETDKKSFSR